MESDWKRKKEIPSETEMVKTHCGGMYLTLGYEDDKLIEVRATIGKNGTCANIMLDTVCKLISIDLQSQMPRYKICEKFKKQFEELKCGQGKFWHEKKEYYSCVDYVAKRVIQELSK